MNTAAGATCTLPQTDLFWLDHGFRAALAEALDEAPTSSQARVKA
jgi:hypothetical protein